MSRILIHVQYLKGIGHLQRVALIAEAAAARGLDVHIVSGGLPISQFAPSGVTLHQLPALQAGPGGFTDLRDVHGNGIDEQWRASRRDQLLALFQRLAPDLLLIESFPFARRALDFELLPLLDAAHARQPRPSVLCSIRDILQANRKPGRAEETVSRLNRYFDAVLVHGDPAFAALEETFPLAGSIEPPLHYTGFTAAPMEAFEATEDTPSGEVLVSMGGGAVGPALLEAALEARAMTPLADADWRLVTGPNLPEDDYARLRRSAGEGVTVERFRNDFRRLLASAKLSISYAGYNTTLDLLRAGTRAVLVAYGSETGGETEQAMRGERLQKLGLAVTLADRDITPAVLAEAIDAALALPTAKRPELDLEGASNSASLLMEWAAQRNNR